MRAFTPLELSNQQYLVNLGITFTQVQITETGLKKSILDATAPMRVYFKENGIHDCKRRHEWNIPDRLARSGFNFIES